MDQKKLLLSPEETCEAIGVKRSTLFKMLDAGEISSIKVGRLRRIPFLSHWLSLCLCASALKIRSVS